MNLKSKTNIKVNLQVTTIKEYEILTAKEEDMHIEIREVHRRNKYILFYGI